MGRSTHIHCSKQAGPQLPDLAVRVEQSSYARDVEPPSCDETNALSPEGRDGVCAPPYAASPASLAPKPLVNPDGPNTATSEDSEQEDFEHVVHLSTPEMVSKGDHEIPSHSPLEHSGHTPRKDIDHTHRKDVALSVKQTNTPESAVSDAYAGLGHIAPLLPLAPMSGPPFLAPKDDGGTSACGWPPTVLRLKFSPDSDTSPSATKPLDNDPCSPPPHRAALWRGARQSASTTYDSEDESNKDEDDFEHIVHLSTPEALDQPSLSGSTVAPCGSKGGALPMATTQASLSSSTCITAVGVRSWKAQNTRAFLDFSPDFSKGISAFAPHQPSNELNAPEGVLKSNDIRPDDGLTTTLSINTYDGGQDSLNSTSDKENICSVDSAILPPHPRGTDHSAVLAGGSSDDDEMDKKLDDLFSDLRIRSTKKTSVMRTVSRKSLEAFIVSDSDVGEDDENIEAPPTTTPPTEHTPRNAPSSRAFVRRPFTERPQLSTPVCNTTQKPSHTHCLTRWPGSYNQLFNQTVFNNQLPENMEIRWNRKMRTTAGFCYNSGLGSNKSSRIELSLKVCSSYDRIRDTLIHELCHAATWLISGIKKGGHGNEWQAWAATANKVYPSIQRIERCHNYDIEYKYMYKCTRCDFRHGRHSKSVDLEHKRCPRCLSTLQLEPKLNVDGTPRLCQEADQIRTVHPR
eukprot:Em0019g744a